MNHLTYLAHAGHIHSEKEIAAMPKIPLVFLIAGIVILVALIIAVVLIQRTARYSKRTVASGTSDKRK